MIDVIIPNSDQPNAHPKAVVIMFGWMGSKPRQVHKYADIYAKRDCAVVVSYAPISAIMRYAAPMRKQVAESVQEAARLVRSAENRINRSQGACRRRGPQYHVPVVLHYLSNGGTYLANELEHMIQEAKSHQLDHAAGNVDDFLLIEDRLRHKGYEVLDSAPAYINVASGYYALKASVSSTTIRLIATVIVYCKFMLLRFIAWMLGMVNETDRFWNKMVSSKLCLRQAFIFSAADKVTDCEKLEELIEMRKSRGITVKVCKFQDSFHVLHMKKYPDLYESFCAEVIETVTSCSVLDADKDDEDEDTHGNNRSVKFFDEDEWWR